MEIETALKADKNYAVRTLEQGVREKCADYITEVIINLENGTCDYPDVIGWFTGIAAVDWFCYFDDDIVNEGMIERDPNRNISFKATAEKIQENMWANRKLPGGTLTHEALKSNSTYIISATLEQLRREGSADQTLIPILEKIAKKDVYRSYFISRGLRADCQLGELAREVIDLIQHPSKPRPPVQPAKADGKCAVCGELPAELRVNYGRDERYPAAYSKLVDVETAPAEFKRCPSCRNYFYCADFPQEYGTGDNAEEKIERFSTVQSQYLDNFFTGGPLYSPDVNEVDECMKIIPIHQLMPALHYYRSTHPESFGYFASRLIEPLGKYNDRDIFDLLVAHVGSDKERAASALRLMKPGREPKAKLLLEFIERCTKLAG